MNKITIKAKPLTKQNFAKYGDVIEIDEPVKQASKTVVTDSNDGSVGVVNAGVVSLPFEIEYFERHMLGTQVFMPITGGKLVLVAAEGTNNDTFDINTAEAFITNGKQGINYKVGTWHTPLRTITDENTFTIIERSNADPDDNIDFAKFENTKIIVE